MPFSTLWDKCQNAFFKLMPQACLVCDLPTGTINRLCRPCFDQLPFLSKGCPQCAQALPMEISDLAICGACLKTPPYFDRTIACCAYTSPVKEWIHRLKFANQLLYAGILSDVLLRQIKAAYQDKLAFPSCVIPVPLHPRRVRKRGYNQALVLARPIAKALALPLMYTGVKRIKYTVAQSQLSQKARLTNVKQAFMCKKRLPYEYVAVVDDVMTTGSTVNALAHCLKQHGVKQVDIWTVARVSKE